jgi:site-specific recombinase XerD
MEVVNMGRRSKLNYSKKHRYHYSTISGKKYYFPQDKKLAQRELDELRARCSRGEMVSNPTVSEIAQDFLAWKREMVKESSFAWYSQPLNKFVKHIGKKKISDLSPSDIQLWIKKQMVHTRHGKRRSENANRQLLRVVKSTTKWAADNGKIPRDPLRTLRVGSYSPSKSVPDEEQLKALLKHWSDDQDFLDLLMFQATTGCRVFEARTITSEQVNRAEKCIVLTEEQSKSYDRLSDKRLRTIVLNDQALGIVERNLDKHPHFDELLFQNPTSRNSSNQWSPSAVHKRFVSAKKQLKFIFPQRSLRHFYITKFLSEHGNLAVAASLVGHSSLTTIQNYNKVGRNKELLLSAANTLRSITIPA